MGRSPRSRTAAALITAVALAAAAPAAAQAATAFAVLPNNGFATFDTATPGAAIAVGTITGIGATETVRSVDFRPADGKLYATAIAGGSALDSLVTTYTVDPATGVATLVGQTAAPVPLAGDVAGGADFDPVVDRLRVVNGNDENFRINPNNGALSGDDVNVNPALTSDLVGLAYDRNVLGATVTTAYAINRATSVLATIGGIDGAAFGGPNGGTVSDVGPLGVPLSATADAGFDIAADGLAYAALTSAGDNITRLYTINLATGAATVIGPVLGGGGPVYSLTIIGAAPPPPQPPPPPPPPPPVAVADRTGPRPVVRHRTIARLTVSGIRAVALRFSCDEPCRAGASLRVGTTVVGSARTRAAASAGRLPLATSRTQRRAIARLRRSHVKRRRATLAMTFTDAAGNVTRVTRTLTLRR
jgi:Domain of unknown function (DUF4394)